jgi:hypothetical protein
MCSNGPESFNKHVKYMRIGSPAKIPGTVSQLKHQNMNRKGFDEHWTVKKTVEHSPAINL